MVQGMWILILMHARFLEIPDFILTFQFYTKYIFAIVTIAENIIKIPLQQVTYFSAMLAISVYITNWTNFNQTQSILCWRTFRKKKNQLTGQASWGVEITFEKNENVIFTYIHMSSKEAPSRCARTILYSLDSNCSKCPLAII